METPRLETERLILRTVCAADAEMVYNSWTCDPEVSKYMYWDAHMSPSETEDWIALEIKRISSDDWYRWVFEEKESGKLIGTAAVYFDAQSQKHMISYNLSRKAWGKGYTTEAVTKIIDYAVKKLGIRRITAEYAKENIRSARVLDKLGFRYVRDIKYTCTEGRDLYDGVECEFVI